MSSSKKLLPFVLVVFFLVAGSAIAVGGGWLLYDLYAGTRSPWAEPNSQFCYPFTFKPFGVMRCVGPLDYTEPWDVGWSMVISGFAGILAGVFVLLFTMRVRRTI